jgi:hypothetical protein
MAHLERRPGIFRRSSCRSGNMTRGCLAIAALHGRAQRYQHTREIATTPSINLYSNCRLMRKILYNQLFTIKGSMLR